MSFDAFEARLHFLQLLRKLNASQPSIQKVVAYAIRYGSRCGEDLWECITEECSKGSLNTRINILYFLDSLLEACQPLSAADAPYLGLVARDLGQVVEGVVPETREGVLNLKSARQILDSWRLRRLVDPHIVDDALHKLDARKQNPSSPRKRTHEETFSRADILRRMEEDRERHKRLRERIWILPIPSLAVPSTSSSRPSRASSTAAVNLALSFQSPASTSPATPASPSRRKTMPSPKTGGERRMPPPPIPGAKDGLTMVENGREGRESVSVPDALEVEFETMWETEMELDEDDLKAMNEQAWISRTQTTATL